ncbi:MAG: hypothetical protein PWP23_1834 [Candidatus Sumerlaeota bacterium]|nr:hypothetical protein [Candidatus Sumerlaeota bacterium]
MPTAIGGIAGLPFLGSLRSGAIGVWVRETFSALHVRNYRLFFFGHGMSMIGTWMRRTAMGWLVYEITGSLSLLGTVMALALLPLFLFAPIAGMMADHFDKRRVILISQVLSGIVSAALAAIVWMGDPAVWQIMVLAALGGCAFALEVPARQAFVVEMVGKDRLLNAIALNSALINLTRTVGPALAGLIMGTVGMAACFALDAWSYLVVIYTLVALRLPPHKPRVETMSRLRQLTEGVRIVFSEPTVRLVLFLLLTTGIFGWAFQSLLPAIAQDNLRVSEARYGVLMSMFGVGAIAGALVTASRARSPNRLRQMYMGAWAMIAGLLFMAFSRAFWPMCVALLVSGFGGVLFVSTGNTMVQLSVADKVRGRVMGIWALAFGGSLPLGSWIGGHLANAIASRAPSSIPLLGRSKWIADEFLGPNAAYFTIAFFAFILLGCVLSSLIFLHPSARMSERNPTAQPEEV